MRFEIIALLSWLVREGYITSFHVTKDKIYVTIKKQPPLVVAGRLLSKIEVQANRQRFRPCCGFIIAPLSEKVKRFSAKSFEAQRRAFFMDVEKSILPTGSGRGELKKTSLFCPFSLKNPPFSPLFSCFNSCRPHQIIIIRTKSS